jgi:hypothetical protein
LNNNGDWKLNGAYSTLVISSGLVYLANKKPKGLHLEEVLGMIKEHPHSSYYGKLIPRRVTLGDALTLGKFELLGQVIDKHSSLDLSLLDPDRNFSELPKTGYQLLNKHYRSKAKRL